MTPCSSVDKYMSNYMRCDTVHIGIYVPADVRARLISHKTNFHGHRRGNFKPYEVLTKLRKGKTSVLPGVEKCIERIEVNDSRFYSITKK